VTGKLWPLIADINAGPFETTVKSAAIVVDHAGTFPEDTHQFWFEHVWSKPQVIELGNMLSTVLREIEIYNAYREADRTLNSATNNAGPGITFVGLPGLPATILSQHGLVFSVQVSIEGPPSIDGTLDFDMDTPDISIPLTGTRVVMFPYEPETPLGETLEFLTDILVANNGEEQRVSVRKNPRQIFNSQYRIPEGHERRQLQNLIFTWHPRVFGVPVWFEARYLGADAVATDTTITVDTPYADFRAGSLAIVWKDYQTFDALEIASLTANSLTFTSGLTQPFTAEQTLIMPLRLASTRGTIKVAHALNSMDEVGIVWTVEDNDSNIGSITGWPIHNSKVMLDGSNRVGGTNIRDDLARHVDALDNLIGEPIQFSNWAVSHPVTTKGWAVRSPQELWQVRQLVHALRGSQVAFYLPTFYKDLVPTADLASGSFLMDIERVGYTDFVFAQEPNKSVRVELNDGTVLTRQVTTSDILDDTTERLTVDVSWPSTISFGDIERVSYLRLSRIADDAVRFQHLYAGEARITMGVMGVQQ
jgi:hypothetical protein